LEDAGFHGRGTPHPPVFAKRGCKLLKINDGGAKKRAKRRQMTESTRVKRDWTARDDSRENSSSVLRNAARRHSREWRSRKGWGEANMRNDSMGMEDNGSVIH
jgi:hypothetical protein